jgi:hypothetical protein
VELEEGASRWATQNPPRSRRGVLMAARRCAINSAEQSRLRDDRRHPNMSALQRIMPDESSPGLHYAGSGWRRLAPLLRPERQPEMSIHRSHLSASVRAWAEASR